MEHKIGHYEVNEPFYDGFLEIICRDGTYIEKILCVEDFACGEEPYTLERIAKEYPQVKILMVETPLAGAVYRYNNYGHNEWTKTGETFGYA